MWHLWLGAALRFSPALPSTAVNCCQLLSIADALTGTARWFGGQLLALHSHSHTHTHLRARTRTRSCSCSCLLSRSSTTSRSVPPSTLTATRSTSTHTCSRYVRPCQINLRCLQNTSQIAIFGTIFMHVHDPLLHRHVLWARARALSLSLWGASSRVLCCRVCVRARTCMYSCVGDLHTNN